jgi:enterochelin esterase-like enzyme
MRTMKWLMAAAAVAAVTGSGTPAAAFSLAEVKTAIARQPDGDEAKALVEHVHKDYGTGKLAEGINPIVEDLSAAWMIEAPGAKSVRVSSADGQYHWTLDKVGATDLYAVAVTLPDKAGLHWSYEVDGTPHKSGDLEVYLMPEEYKVRPEVPHGTVAEHKDWKSTVFDGTKRDWWVYTPAQYDGTKPVCLMVFQDGRWPKDYAPPVLDNLIARGDIPVMAAVFIDPGHFDGGGSNRNFEYDTLSDQYARFVIDEILPEVEKTVKLRHDPASRAITGSSSGGICAWTVAWEWPNEFGKVLTWVGSFVNLAPGKTGIAGGHNCAALIRGNDRKPIRIFLQDGENDIDNQFGNWPLANQTMAKALAFKGYDYKFEFGHGFHSDRHGRAILPDSLRWLWRGWRP